MSMTRKLWSLSALAVEFEIDRRAVARRIDGIAPAGEIKGKPAWRLVDVAPALAHGTGKAAKEPIAVPPGFEQLARLAPIDQIATYAMLQMCYRTPAQMASLAVASGASCAAAYALHKVAMVSMMQLMAEVSKECLIAPLADTPEASVFDLEAFERCNWAKLAENAGEIVNIDAWERLKVEHFSANGLSDTLV